MKEIDRVIKPQDLIEGQVPVFDNVPKNAPQRLFELSKIIKKITKKK